ncbi:hypothetical protein HDU85_001423 [Gaertneriomyces sp. JEL0708]|nr:hypothetical protein HDU85_001423 [Gaertneriomyces sp. JEL0708]
MNTAFNSGQAYPPSTTAQRHGQQQQHHQPQYFQTQPYVPSHPPPTQQHQPQQQQPAGFGLTPFPLDYNLTFPSRPDSDSYGHHQLLTSQMTQGPVGPVQVGDPAAYDFHEGMDMHAWNAQHHHAPQPPELQQRHLVRSALMVSESMWPLFPSQHAHAPVPPPTHILHSSPVYSASLKRKSESDAYKTADKPVVSTRRKACEPCRSKKLRCDGLRPSCSTCQRAAAGPKSCVYYADNPRAATAIQHAPPSSEVERDKKKRSGDVKALEDRVKALEAMLASAMATAAGTATASPTSDQGFHERPWSEPALSPLSEPATVPSDEFRLVAAAVRSSFFDDVLTKMSKVMKRQKAELANQPPAECGLPDVGQIILRFDLIEIYFSRPSAHFPFHFLHRQLFMQTIKHESPMLLFALYAAVAPCSPSEQVRNSVPSFFARARSLVSVHVECPTLSGLQGILLLCSASIYLGLMSTAWMYLGMACRMAQFLRLDVDPDVLGISNWAEAESRRRTWWGLVILDSMSSSVINRASVFGGDGGPVRLPCAEAIFDHADVNGTIPAHMRGVHYDEYTAMFARITKTYAEIIEYNRHTLHHGKVFSVVDPQLTLLLAELQAWHDSLPPAIQQAPRTVSGLSSLASFPCHSVSLYLLHKCCLCLLWRPRMVLALSERAHHAAAVQAIEAAQTAARDLSRTLEILLSVNADDSNVTAVDYIPFSVTFGFVEAALIHILSYAMAQVRNISEDLEPPMQVLAPISHFLKLLGQRLPPAQIMYDAVAEFERNLPQATGGEHGAKAWVDWFNALFRRRNVKGVSPAAAGTNQSRADNLP